MIFFTKNINANDKRTLYDFSFNNIDGKKYLLSQHKNKVVSVLAKTAGSSLGVADITNFTGVFYSPESSATFIGDWNSLLTYTKNQIVLVDNNYCLYLVNYQKSSRIVLV